MSLFEIITAAIWQHFERHALVILSDGREVEVAPDLDSVEELAREIETAISMRSGGWTGESSRWDVAGQVLHSGHACHTHSSTCE